MVGFAVDRVGVRRLILAGIVIVTVGFVIVSQANSLLAFYAGVVFIAIGNSANGGATATVAIAHWFRRRRGRALGIMTLGGGLSGMTAIIFALLISTFGWRDALLIVGVTQLVLCVPLALSLRNRPSDMGLPMDGVAEDVLRQAQEGPLRQAQEGQPAEHEPVMPLPEGQGFTSREALRSALFWKVALVFALSNFATTAIIVHQVPFLVESVGTSEAFAAATVTIMTGISLAGRLGLGVIADVVSKRLVTAAALLAIAASLLLFTTVHEAWQLVYVLPLFGLGFGGVIPVRSSLQAEYFGLKAFGAIQGMTLTISTLGAFAGPVLAGWLYDVSDSYRLAFVLLAAGPLLAVPLILSAKPHEHLTP